MDFHIGCKCNTGNFTIDSARVKKPDDLTCPNCLTTFSPDLLKQLRKINTVFEQCSCEIDKTNINSVSFSGRLQSFSIPFYLSASESKVIHGI